jgi:uncharacterized protein YacL
MAIIEIILLLIILGVLISQHEGIGKVFKFRTSQKVLLDSCALIDGRIVDMVSAGFIADELVIPQFIINELQMLADGQDAHKRERARFGLDIAQDLQNDTSIKVTIDRSVLPNVTATDDKLVALAKKLPAKLYTTDYNLGKVAGLESVKVLNINELAQSLRPISLPGESIEVKILQKGSNSQQGVGYMEDGTMIVVDGAARDIGRKIKVVVDRMHQTVAGKMVFGHTTQPVQPVETRKEQPRYRLRHKK